MPRLHPKPFSQATFLKKPSITSFLTGKSTTKSARQARRRRLQARTVFADPTDKSPPFVLFPVSSERKHVPDTSSIIPIRRRNRLGQSRVIICALYGRVAFITGQSARRIGSCSWATTERGPIATVRLLANLSTLHRGIYVYARSGGSRRRGGRGLGWAGVGVIGGESNGWIAFSCLFVSVSGCVCLSRS